jgi:hypothetical protein
MAEEKKPVNTVNEDDALEKEIKGGNIFDKSIVDAAAKKIADKNKEVQIEVATKIVGTTKFEMKRAQIVLQKKRKDNQAYAEKLKAITQLLGRFTDGGMTAQDFFTSRAEIQEDAETAYRKNAEHYDELKASLKQQFPTIYTDFDFGYNDTAAEEEKTTDSEDHEYDDGKDLTAEQKAKMVKNKGRNAAENAAARATMNISRKNR